MKFSVYVENLNKLLKDRPDTADMEVVTSKDDEGNGFNLVYYTPTIGYLGEDRDFTEEKKANAVCVN